MFNDKFIERKHPAPQTHAAISMKNKLFAVNARDQHAYLGAVSRFEVNQGRSVDAVKGIGAGDNILELVPNYSDIYTFSFETTLFYLRNLFQIFGYTSGVEGLVRSLRHHKYPFDVKQELVFSEIAELEADSEFVQPSSDGHLCLVTYYEACWINSYRHGYTTDSSKVMESAEVSVTDIVPAFSAIDPNMNTGNSVKSKNGLTQWYRPVGSSGGAGGILSTIGGILGF